MCPARRSLATSPATPTPSSPSNYAVSETGGPSGYAATISGDCDPQSGAVTLDAGDDKTCTITNDDIPPKLTVIKHVINDSGTGTASAGAFTMIVEDPGTIQRRSRARRPPARLSRSIRGVYSVSESGPSGYAQSLSADCSGSLAIGQTRPARYQRRHPAGRPGARGGSSQSGRARETCGDRTWGSSASAVRASRATSWPPSRSGTHRECDP